MDDNRRADKILIVDDVETNVDILLGLLNDSYEITVALDGKTALESVQEEPPDLILLDIMMPDMDGWEVCQRLKADPLTKDILIIFLTAKGHVEDEVRGFRMGAVDYITKPFEPIVVQSRLATHLELKRKRDLLANLSALDGLTGIPNRRSFDNAFHREWSRAVRNGHPLSLILMDIDFFKTFNDNYGHAAGDECLKTVGRSLVGIVHRAPDLLARYGGEEFVCLLPETDFAGVQVVAEQLRSAVVELAIVHEHSQVASTVTLSLGATTVIPDSPLQPQALLEMADALLYESKKAGRNRVTARLFSKAGRP